MILNDTVAYNVTDINPPIRGWLVVAFKTDNVRPDRRKPVAMNLKATPKPFNSDSGHKQE